MNQVTQIKFRMYHTGSVGDCLLLLFYKGQELSFRMLIDCGGFNAPTADITKCAKDIFDTCGGRLDLLVLTHEHLDHISGFNQARKIFEDMKVDQVWMSWVENDTDPVGKLFRDKYGKKIKELKKQTEDAIQALKTQARRVVRVKGFDARLDHKQLKMEDTLALLNFEEGASHGPGLAAGRLSNADAMTFLKTKTGHPKYRKPGEVLTGLPGAEGIRFFILGPPRDRDLKYIAIDLEDEEMYALAARPSPPESARDLDGSEPIAATGPTLQDHRSPFPEQYHLTGAELKRFNAMYNTEAYKWRQIETDWMENAAGVALRMTNLLNNTSLAMALEFEATGRVLLLPADAQSGNWMSWHTPTVSNKLKKHGGKTTDELLASTIFYKVGHHGSHNGTASHSGLDGMTHADLVAFMPLVQAKVPKAWGGAKNFPAGPLYHVLINKTKGRMVRTDEGIIKDPAAKKLRDLLPSAEQNAFKGAFKKGSCYLEFTIE